MQQRVEDKLVITSFTDPVCTWCWGSEPVLRALETHFPGRVVVRYVMGGLVEDAHRMNDLANGIGSSDLDAFNRQVASHWLEASGRHGMPVDAENFHLFSDELPSTYPQNVAYEAAKLADPDRADAFLYELRAATAAEARVTSREDEQITIADSVGIDVVAFLEKLSDGSAARAFTGDMNLIHGLGGSGFPTFIVKYNDQEVMLRGYRTYETFAMLAERLSGGALEPVEVKATQGAVMDLAMRRPRVAAEEVRQAFDLGSQDEAWSLVAPLVESGALVRFDAGNGWFVQAVSTADGVCDPISGTCS